MRAERLQTAFGLIDGEGQAGFEDGLARGGGQVDGDLAVGE
jgi:hypothetical protein